ncbi:MAG: arsenite methyltransferase, partial [Candidatus Hydrogenedentes bacterium]|nr:arsenite methyltransferase [Candidatus Hydrogenedentota bacterium]
MKEKSPCGCGTSRQESAVQPTPESIKRHVREYYGAAVSEDGPAAQSCCSSSCCDSSSPSVNAIKEKLEGSYATHIGYTEEELASIPEHAAGHSYGCGNPLAFSEVKEGDVVLDLGSGAGIDVLLASQKVGPSGRVIGLDMTPEMIEKAEQNALEANVSNVEFRLGEMEDMPIEDSNVDWIVSNCVISLSPDKEAVFREAFRVLKPGGRMLISDICVNGIEAHVRDELFQWADCIGGALDEETYLSTIRRAGFVDVEVIDKKTFSADVLKAFVRADEGLSAE